MKGGWLALLGLAALVGEARADVQRTYDASAFVGGITMPTPYPAETGTSLGALIGVGGSMGAMFTPRIGAALHLEGGAGPRVAAGPGHLFLHGFGGGLGLVRLGPTLRLRLGLGYAIKAFSWDGEIVATGLGALAGIEAHRGAFQVTVELIPQLSGSDHDSRGHASMWAAVVMFGYGR